MNNLINLTIKKGILDSKNNFKKIDKKELSNINDTISSYPRYRVYIDKDADDLEKRNNTMDFNFKDYPKRNQWYDVVIPILSINVKDAFNSKEEFLKNHSSVTINYAYIFNLYCSLANHGWTYKEGKKLSQLQKL